MPLSLKPMRKRRKPCGAQMATGPTIQCSQVSQQGHKRLKYNQSKHKDKAQLTERRMLCVE